MSEEEKRKLEAFIYWVETNTEIGVSTIPDYICKNVLNLIEKQQKEIENIKKEVQEHIAFENRLKRDNTEPDLFNQGRFYVANNINDILENTDIYASLNPSNGWR